jgi:hypothetical protein
MSLATMSLYVCFLPEVFHTEGIIQEILKRYRFDLLPGIEHDYANWEKISTFVGYSLTQCRSRLKKMVSQTQHTLILGHTQIILS